MASTKKFKARDDVRIKPYPSVDCPSGVGTVLADMSSENCEEYEVMYSDGEDFTYGMFYADELESL